MRNMIAGSWKILGLRGLIAILFGALALSMPGITLLSLVTLFAAYALVGGIVSVFLGVRNKTQNDNWWLWVLWGLVSIGAGIMTVMHPDLSALLLVLLIGANALVTGTLDLVAAVQLRKTIKGEWLLGFNGLVSIVFGILIFLFPGPGALALVWLIGAYALITGGLLIAVAIHLRSATKNKPLRDRRANPDRRVSQMPG
jgi:uncharacterized membrane protein HdeD (DUF308 family)